MSDIFNSIEIKPNTSGLMPSVSAPKTQPVAAQQVTPEPVNQDMVSDTVEISAKKQKKGPIKSLKGFISNVKKFFATAGEYIKGGAKGIATGAVSGAIIYSGGEVTNKLLALKAGINAKNIAKQADKSIPKAELKSIAANAKEACKKIKFHKPIAIAAAGVAIVAGLWNASLNASEKRSNIEHRYIGHNK